MAALMGRYKDIKSLASNKHLMVNCVHPNFTAGAIMAQQRVDLDTSYNASDFLPIRCSFWNGEIPQQDLVQTPERLQGQGADLNICDQKNKYTLTNFCITRSTSLLNYLLDNLVFTSLLNLMLL